MSIRGSFERAHLSANDVKTVTVRSERLAVIVLGLKLLSESPSPFAPGHLPFGV